MANAWIPEGATKLRQSITSDWVFTDQQLIEGVSVKEIKNVLTEDGWLTEIFRTDWGLGPAPVAQVFQKTMQPHSVSAWHAHGETTDRLFVARGVMKVVLYDDREGSSSHGVVNEFWAGELRPYLIVVPPRVWHGIKNLGSKIASILNLVDRAYSYDSPDHWRLPHDTSRIPYRF